MRPGFLWRTALPIAVAVYAALWVLGGDRGPDGESEAVVTLSVVPRFMLARSDIHVTARIPHDSENRRLAIAWSSDKGSVGETQRQLDGEDAPLIEDVWLRSQPPANYAFVATVFGRTGKIRGSADAFIVAVE